MIHKTSLPKDSEERLRSLGPALQQCSGVLFAYLFGGATVSPLKPLSDVDVAVTLMTLSIWSRGVWRPSA
ncbi:hypothetical protein [Candidatus Methylomirabilis limnetica]|uniref:hypothetical protein n=1 Tax=Candidatus Methylomirabilis limnetica TaxID=2033718 RepID=UPI0010573E59|nr:hypothetical protein [Candidatus Methylomirabilis limnetica]